MVYLVKGQKADLTKTNPSLQKVIIGMGWKSSNTSIKVDFSAFLLTSASKVTRDDDLIFYGNPTGPNNSISIPNGNASQDKAQVVVTL
jgi:tellurite resistance protein TerA